MDKHGSSLLYCVVVNSHVSTNDLCCCWDPNALHYAIVVNGIAAFYNPVRKTRCDPFFTNIDLPFLARSALAPAGTASQYLRFSTAFYHEGISSCWQSTININMICFATHQLQSSFLLPHLLTIQNHRAGIP